MTLTIGLLPAPRIEYVEEIPTNVVLVTLQLLCTEYTHDNTQAGSPASIVDKEGNPRWYALWALLWYLWSQIRAWSLEEKQREAQGARKAPKAENGHRSQTHRSILVTPEQSSSSKTSIGPSMVSALATQTSRIVPAPIDGS